MRFALLLLVLFTTSCSMQESSKEFTTDDTSSGKLKERLLSLERKWLEAEFALDRAYLSALPDSTFTGIAPDHISNKQQALKGMHDTISAMRKDSVFLGSLKLEEGFVNVYGDCAAVSFIVHTYKKDKGKPVEKRTRFYDVWVKRNGEWKAVASQGTALTNQSQ